MTLATFFNDTRNWEHIVCTAIQVNKLNENMAGSYVSCFEAGVDRNVREKQHV